MKRRDAAACPVATKDLVFGVCRGLRRAENR